MIERREDGSYWPYLMDFGLARQMDGTSQSSVMGIAGTPGYMSPEQARGDHHIDHRTDVYGLGATLYSILCGQPPFAGNALEVLADVVTKYPRSPRTIDRSLPAELDTLILKCLEKEAPQRYQTAKALADDLLRHLQGLPIRTRPTSLAQRLARWARHHKRIMASLASVIATMVLMGAVALRARLQAVEQARLAQHLGQEIAKMEWLLRSGRQLPLHNLSREKAIIHKRMQQLQTELAAHGGPGRSLAHYALGRGHLALHEYPQALAELQAAMQEGNENPELNYALGLVLGRHFEQALQSLRLSGGGGWAQKKKKELEARYLQPAIAALQRSRTAQLDAPEYLEALLSFYRHDYADALKHAAIALEQCPWMYEADKLAGDVHHEQALEARDRGRYEEAQQEFAAAVRSYEAAARSGQSDAEVYEGLAETWVRQVEMEATRGQPTEAAYAAAVTVSDKILVAEPQSTAGLLKKAFATLMSLSLSGSGQASSIRIGQCLDAAAAVLKQESDNPYASEVAASCYTRAAELALAQGKDPEPLWRQASAVLERALRRAPYFLWGLNDLGNIYAVRGAYRALHGDPTARHELERALASYQAATALDEDYLIGWQNTLGCLDELVYLASKEEQNRSLIPLVEQVFGKCQSLNGKYQPCYNNYAIFYVRLARIRFMAGEEQKPYLEQARARFSELKQLGGNYLDTEQHLAMMHLIDASNQVREGLDPTAELTELRAALARCFTLAEKDVTCQTLSAQAEWVEAERLALLGKSPLPALTSALRQANLAASSPEQHPDAFFTLAETHLRMTRAVLHDRALRDLHVREGLAATDQALSINPEHGPSRQTQKELRLLSAQAQLQATSDEQGDRAVARHLDADRLYLPISARR